MKKGWTILAFIVYSIVIVGLGFWVGKSSVKISEKVTIEYIDIVPFSVTFKPTEIGFTVPNCPKWIFFTDTIDNTEKIDTAAILNDWSLRREYAEIAHQSDTIGTIRYTAAVQYNRLDFFKLDLSLKQKTVTTTKTIEQKIIPFAFVGGWADAFSVGGGVFCGDWGGGLEYNYVRGENSYLVKAYKKF